MFRGPCWNGTTGHNGVTDERLDREVPDRRLITIFLCVLSFTGIIRIMLSFFLCCSFVLCTG